MVTPGYSLLLDAMEPVTRPAPPRCPSAEGWTDRRWQLVMHQAEWHRLAPALARHLHERPVTATPEWVFAGLERRELRDQARSLLVSATATTALKALDAAGIPAMALKGAALVEVVYENAATRDMGDLDLLVPDALLDAANDALAAVGFRPDRPDVHDRLRAESRAKGDHHDAALVHGGALLPLELHRNIVGPRDAPARVDIEAVWARSTAATTGPPHRLPSPENLLLHLCLHFTHGREVRSEGALAQLRDILWTLDRLAVDGDAFVEIARDANATGRTFLALYSLVVLGFVVPGRVLAALRPPGFDDRLGRRFVVLRVLPHQPRLPVETWPRTPDGLRNALMWSRRNLGRHHIQHGAAPTDKLTRPAAAAALAGRVARHPVRLRQDLHLAGWLDDVCHTDVRG